MRRQRGIVGKEQPPGWSMSMMPLPLALAVLISFWPAATGAASIECPDWQSPAECSNSNKTDRDDKFMNDSMLPDNLLDMDLERDGGDNWPLERIVSIIVPVFFGIIGFAGLLGNALVILGKSTVSSVSFSLCLCLQRLSDSLLPHYIRAMARTGFWPNYA